MDFFKIIDVNIDISEKKEVKLCSIIVTDVIVLKFALNAISFMAAGQESIKNDVIEFFNSKYYQKGILYFCHFGKITR